ncbi:hypothetical protein [Pseudomonas sp. B21-048]|uniref:hypothetical protein n=1 Tax=Pseudomonas sp. B21-048 TaxID=2895490 RepID=UPI00216029F5|nr:hypothetical protein [Pseudomonas sp. B21-048]UVL01457.1 hypothetical protein LOY56_12210 [Pseudomonas sp. B21-048]
MFLIQVCLSSTGPMALTLSEPSKQDCRVLAMSELSPKAIPPSFSLPPEVDAILLEASRVRTLVKSEAVFPQGSEPLEMFPGLYELLSNGVMQGRIDFDRSKLTCQASFLEYPHVAAWYERVNNIVAWQATGLDQERRFREIERFFSPAQ